MKELNLYSLILELQLENDRPTTTGELRNRLKIPNSTLYRMIEVLLVHRLIYRVKRGNYAVSSYWLASALNDVSRSYDTVKWIKAL